MQIGISFNPEPGTGIARYSRNLLIALGNHTQEELQFTGFSFCKRDPRPAWLPETIGYHDIFLPGKLQNKLHRHIGMTIETLTGLKEIEALHTTDLFLARTRLPRITTVHDVAWRHSPEFCKGVVSSRWIEEAEQAIKEADHICAVSSMTAQDLMNGGVSSKKITVAYLGTDDRFGIALPSEGERVRQKYRLPDKFILSVGSINPRKNLPCLVSALASMKSAPMLVIAGPKPPEGLEHWGLNQGNSKHLGFLPDEDVPGLYLAAELLVFPSFLEGFGLPLVEAMASGVPVIASRIPVFAELGGDAPFYFDPHDAATLRKALEAVLSEDELALEMREKGKSQSASFSWGRCADATVSAYQASLGAK